MNVWQDIRQMALHGAFNEIAPAIREQYHAAWPKRRGLTGIIPFNERGAPLIKEEAFVAGMEAGLVHSRHGGCLAEMAACVREDTLTTARQEAGDLYQSIVRQNAASPKRGGYLSSTRPLPGLMDMIDENTGRLEAVSIQVREPLALERGPFAQAVAHNPRQAFTQLVDLVTTLGHEMMGHGVSRLEERPGSAYNTPLTRNIEEVRANIFGTYVAGLVFGPDMVWQMKRHSINPGSDHRYFAPTVYRAAARDMHDMFNRSPEDGDHPAQRGLPWLYEQASSFAERQHLDPDTRKREADRIWTLARFETRHGTNGQSRLDRLDEARGHAVKNYGTFYPAVYLNDRWRSADLNPEYVRRLCANNPLKCG